MRDSQKRVNFAKGTDSGVSVSQRRSCLSAGGERGSHRRHWKTKTACRRRAGAAWYPSTCRFRLPVTTMIPTLTPADRQEPPYDTETPLSVYFAELTLF